MRIQLKFAALLFFTMISAFPNASSAKSGMPYSIYPPGEKVIVIDPRIHAWGAYTSDGTLVRSGLASAGRNWCADINRACRTHTGSFRIYYLGDSSCISARFPIPTGGAPMPYCMYFNGNQALHGSYELGNANLSHGCVRMRVGDAKWLRFNFVEGPNYSNDYQGTLVVVRPY